MLGFCERKRSRRHVRRHDVIGCPDLGLQIGGDRFIIVDYQNLLSCPHGFSLRYLAVQRSAAAILSLSCAERVLRGPVLDDHAVQVRAYRRDAPLEIALLVLCVMLDGAALRRGPRESVECEAARET